MDPFILYYYRRNLFEAYKLQKDYSSSARCHSALRTHAFSVLGTMSGEKHHITKLKKLVTSMFLHNGVSTKTDVADFLKTINEVAPYVSRREWDRYETSTVNHATGLIFKLKTNSGSSNNRGSSSNGSSSGGSSRGVPSLKVNVPSSRHVRALEPRVIMGPPPFCPFVIGQ